MSDIDKAAQAVDQLERDANGLDSLTLDEHYACFNDIRQALEQQQELEKYVSPCPVCGERIGHADGCRQDQPEVEQKRVPDTPEQALNTLSAAMRADPGYAWSWHCNLAMMAVDAGAPPEAANERARGFMWSTFGVNTSELPTAAPEPEQDG